MPGFNIGTNTVIDEKAGVVFKHQSIVADASVQGTQTKIKASDPSFNDQFGDKVAVGCGKVVVAQERDDDLGTDAGAIYIFSTTGTQLAKIKGSDTVGLDKFGNSVAIGNGKIVVGSPDDDDTAGGSGSAYIFDLNGTQVAKIKASDPAASDSFGWSVAVGSGRIVVGSYLDDDNGTSSGSAYIFRLSGGTQLAKIKASDAAAGDNFGFSVAVGCGRIVVGAYSDADLGTETGSAYLFDLDGNQLAKIKSSDIAAGDRFSYSVAIGSGRIVVGAYFDDDNGSNSGSAYIFDLNGTQLAKIKASDGAASDYFGHSVAAGCGRIVVGAMFDDSPTDAGAAYVYDLNGTQLAKIRASDLAASDWFGYSVAIGSGRMVVGAPSDDDTAADTGSAYIYNLGDSIEATFEDILEGYGKE